jgi:hypothetical protein
LSALLKAEQRFDIALETPARRASAAAAGGVGARQRRRRAAAAAARGGGGGARRRFGVVGVAGGGARISSIQCAREYICRSSSSFAARFIGTSAAGVGSDLAVVFMNSPFRME